MFNSLAASEFILNARSTGQWKDRASRHPTPWHSFFQSSGMSANRVVIHPRASNGFALNVADFAWALNRCATLPKITVDSQNLGLMKPRERARTHQRLAWRNELLNGGDLGRRADVLDEQAAFDEQGRNACVRKRFAGRERETAWKNFMVRRSKFGLDRAVFQRVHVFCVRQAVLRVLDAGTITVNGSAPGCLRFAAFGVGQFSASAP